MKPLISNIQRFCVHDGPGIRTTVFFKGCTLHCPWCANPENISFKEEYYYIKEKCSRYCKYIDECKAYIAGTPCKRDLMNCCFGAVGQFGKYYSNDELYEELIKDIAFYGEEGGVTFSGGECLLFLPHYNQVLKKLREKRITTCVETALFVPCEKIEWAIDNIDYFFVDIKSLQKDICKEILGGAIGSFLTNVKILHTEVSRDRIIYRIPLVDGITLQKDNIEKIKKLIMCFPPKRVEIFFVHNLGAKKYQRLNMERSVYSNKDSSILTEVQKYLEDTNVDVIINTF